MELIRWETDSYPGFHPDGPQGLIDPVIRVEDCDILVGIFWKRFGTPTKESASGTAHEFQVAYEAWKKNNRPQVMVYFNQKSYSPQSKEETDQWGQVLQFRKEFPKEGLWWPYRGSGKFEDLLRNHLTNFVRANFPVGSGVKDALSEAQPSSQRPSRSRDYFAVQTKIIEEYTKTFVGRAHAREAFEGFLRNQRRGYFIVRGAPGQGKTAFSCHLVKERGYVHHFISRTGGRMDSRLILRSLTAQLLPLSNAAECILPDSLSDLTKAFEELLLRATARHKKVVIVIDALDELPESLADEPPYLVSDGLPDGVVFVATSRPNGLLDRLQGRRFSIPMQLYDLGPLEISEMQDILNSWKPGISIADVERISESSQGNPLYLRAIADQLESHPDYDLATLPATIEGFFRSATSGLNGGNVILRDVLGLLSAARTSLSVRDLSKIIGCQLREVSEQGIRPIRQFLLEVDDSYTFYHSRFHEFVVRTILYEDEFPKIHSKLANWLQLPENSARDYRWSSLAYHLFESGQHGQLLKTINEQFLADKASRLGYAVLEDIELCTSSLLLMGDPALIERCVSLVKSLRGVLGDTFVPNATKIMQPYRSGPEAFRTRVIEPFVQSVPGLDVYVGVLPKGEVAADFFEIIPIPPRLLVAIGDVPSIGLKSSFVARFLGRLFRDRVDKHKLSHLNEILAYINSTIQTHEYFERVSMQCAEIDPSAGIIRIANAGHPYPVHFFRRRGKCDILPLCGDLLHNPFRTATGPEQYEEYAIEISPGDVFVLITDGLTEDHIIKGDPYAYRFTQIVEAHAMESARSIGEAVLDSWRAHPREEDAGDDASIIVAKIGYSRVAAESAKLTRK